MNTWWFQMVGGSQPYHMAVVANDVEEAIQIIQSYNEGAPAGTEVFQWAAPEEMEGCSQCDHRDGCVSSVWDDRHRLGDDREWNFTEWSSTHTCPVCMEKVIDFHQGEKAEQRNIIPDACPRWGPLFGSAVACEGCCQERDEIRRAHPHYRARVEAAGGVLGSLRETVKGRAERPENVESLVERRHRKEAIRGMTESMDPTALLREAVEDPELEPRFDRALTLLAEFWPEAMGRSQFQEGWERALQAGLEVWQIDLFYAQWLEALFLALGRHPHNPEGLVWEWLLAFTDNGVILRGWCRLTIPERKLLIRMWEGMARRVLAE